MAGNEDYSFDILFTTRVLRKKSNKKPIRTNYLWANTVVIEDVNDRCPVIEG
jgi:hypothetical protein|tara:strand:+ start:1129 stop:1284 length:156 start_codon:yes stop_codon:yes gene_type:complete